MAREHLAHFRDDLFLLARKLRRAGFTPFLVRSDRGRGPGALDQVLDLHLAARPFVRTLDDHARRVAAVGIFELVAHIPGVAEIKLGANIFVAQACNEFLVIRDAVAIEHADHHGAEFGAAVELPEQGQRRLQARDANGKSGCRYRLAAKAGHKAIIAPAAPDRTEAHRPALFVLGVEQKLHFEDRAGVIFKTAHHGGIDLDTIRSVTGRGGELTYLVEFVAAFLSDLAVAQPRIGGHALPPIDRTEHKYNVLILQACAFREVA